MQLLLDIKDSRFDAFLNFIKTLDYISITEQNEIPQWAQDIVLKRKNDNEPFINENDFFEELNKQIS